MRKSVLSEKNLVVVLFVMVFITFSFAEKDTKKIEKMFNQSNTSATISPDQTESAEAIIKTPDIKQVMPAVLLR
jgi:hypothetical protein